MKRTANPEVRLGTHPALLSALARMQHSVLKLFCRRAGQGEKGTHRKFFARPILRSLWLRRSRCGFLSTARLRLK